MHRIHFFARRAWLALAHRALLAACAALLVFTAPAPRAVADDAKDDSGERIPILWEVKTEPKIYLFGTIHVADPRVTTHPEVVKRALAESQALYTELDFGNLDPSTLIQHIMIPDGKSLKDIASAETMAKLEKVVARYDLSQMQVMQFQRTRPWLTAVQLPVTVNAKRKAEEAATLPSGRIVEGEEGAQPVAPETPAQALDLLLYAGAKAEGKLVGGLELPEEQFTIFNDISLEKQVEMLDGSLDEILKLDAPSEGGEEGSGEAPVDPIEALIRMYVRADLKGFHDLMEESMGDSEEMTSFMHKLLDKRNVVMVRRMLEAAERHPDKPMFIAVGAGHYSGDMGILNLLEKTGYRVRPLRTVADMEKPWPKAGAEETSSRAAPAGRARCCPPRLRLPRLPRGCCPVGERVTPGY